jgi:hypothetical protein
MEDPEPIISIRRDVDRQLRAIISQLYGYELPEEQITKEMHEAVDRVLQKRIAVSPSPDIPAEERPRDERLNANCADNRLSQWRGSGNETTAGVPT